MRTVFKLIFLITALVGIAPRGFGQISIINLGTSRNAFSNAFGIRQNIVASNASNSVALVHRHTLPGSSGTVKADVSIDGGNTWVVNKMETWTAATATQSARYPRAALINPTGNTNGSNAVLVSAQPTIDGSNGAWGGLGLASYKLDGSSLGSQALSSSSGSFMHQLPSSVISAGNKVFILDKNGDINATTFSDTLLLTTGTFNGSSFQWNRQFINFPTGTGSNGKAGIADMTMAFDPTGQIGYILALTHIDFVSDTASNYLPVLMKTSDGGNTWSNPVQLNIGTAVNNIFNLGSPISIGTGIEVSATVDYLGNCHWVTNVGEATGAFNIITAPGKSGTFHFSSNGSTLLSCTKIGAPGSLGGTFGIGTSTLNQGTRPCASRNEAGKTLFFSWFETDSNISPVNDQPDLWSVGYDVRTQTHTTEKNITKNTLAEGKMIFGSVAPIVFERIGSNGFIDFELPVSFVELNASGDVYDSTYHRYLKGAVITMTNLAPIISSNGKSSICDGVPVTLSSNTTSNKQWYRNGQILTGDTSQTYLATVAGSYFLVSNGDTSNTITITVNSKPILNLPDTIFYPQRPFILFPGTANRYLWNSGDTTPSVSLDRTGKYVVEAFNSIGCSQKDSTYVLFKLDIIISKSGNLCFGDTLEIQSSAAQGNHWFRNDSIFNTGGSSILSITKAGNYYSVVGIDTSNILVINGPPDFKQRDTIITSNFPVTLYPGIANTYRWNNGLSTPSIVVNQPGSYFVTGKNSSDCVSSSVFIVGLNQSAPAPFPTQAAALNYQASLTNSQGQPLANSTVGVRFSVYDSTSTSFSETQTVTTDARGHFTTRIGQGTAVVGSLGAISWWDGKPRNLKTEVDFNNSGNWTNLGNSPLVMVPYSMYSLRSDDGRRSIFGSINASGNILSGRGFTVTNLGNYQFQINFLQPFSEIPNVILEPVGSSPSLNLLSRNLHKFVVQFTGTELQFEVKGF